MWKFLDRPSYVAAVRMLLTLPLLPPSPDSVERVHGETENWCANGNKIYDKIYDKS